jgi:hypothetical protein
MAYLDGAGVVNGGVYVTARAWINFNGVAGASARSSYNATSVARNSLGNYTFNFNSVGDTNFVMTGSTTSAAVNVPSSFHAAGAAVAFTKTATSIQFRTIITSTGAANDAAEINIVIFR